MSTQVSTISPQQLHEVKRRGRYAPVLDVRSVAEYRAGHIPGAQLIPIDSLSADALAHAFKRPSLGREETLYITCHTGPRALQAAERLRRTGFDNLSLIEGGTKSWEQLGLLEKRQRQEHVKLSKPADYFISDPAALIDLIHKSGLKHMEALGEIPAFTALENENNLLSKG